MSESFSAVLDRILDGGDMTEDTARTLMDDVLDGSLGEVRIAALVTALRTRRPTVAELTGFARSMRAHARRVDAGTGVVLDNCGTGGAPCKAFNVSTAAAFVLAADGIKVAKHGNRSVTRPSGSADVLESAGTSLDASPEFIEGLLREHGIAFLFAPAFHPAMRHAGPVRQALGIKTVFNLLGPLTNPAGATHQVLGVYDASLLPIMGGALAHLGSARAFVLHGEPGFDEATPCGPVHFVEVADGQAADVEEVDPVDLGIPRCTPELIGPVPRDDAPTVIRGVLAGDEQGPRADTVALNAAFGLVAAGHADDLASGVARARELLASGAGSAKWDAFLAATRQVDTP